MGCDTVRGKKRPQGVGRWQEGLGKERRGWTWVAEAETSSSVGCDCMGEGFGLELGHSRPEVFPDVF